MFKLTGGAEDRQVEPRSSDESNVTNLCSAFRLSDVQRDLLEKGLTFVPTPERACGLTLRRDVHLYHRRLKILDHFDYDRDFEHEPFTEPSKWEPKGHSICSPVRALVRRDREALRDLSVQSEKNRNITESQSRALKQLACNQEVIIKPADKGGQLVLQDRHHYLMEAHRQLMDADYYRPLVEPMQLETQALVRLEVDNMYLAGIISKKQRLYLYGPPEPRMRQFYLLPKIHKSPESWTIPHVLPKGRPIVSDCGSESYRITEFIDFFINPLSQKHPSYVKDTYSFVEEITKMHVPPGSFLFTVDVDSLYTNIDTELGLRALQSTFNMYPDPSRPDAHIIDLLRITLTRNDFEFNGKYYLQVCGCAMGRKYSPSYADIYLARWEEEAFS